MMPNKVGNIFSRSFNLDQTLHPRVCILLELQDILFHSSLWHFLSTCVLGGVSSEAVLFTGEWIFDKRQWNEQGAPPISASSWPGEGCLWASGEVFGGLSGVQVPLCKPGCPGTRAGSGKRKWYICMMTAENSFECHLSLQMWSGPCDDDCQLISERSN